MNVSDTCTMFSDATYGDVTMCDQLVRLYCDAQMCGRPSRDPNPHNVGPSKVVNGDVAEIEAWPWMATLMVCVIHAWPLDGGADGMCHPRVVPQWWR